MPQFGGHSHWLENYADSGRKAGWGIINPILIVFKEVMSIPIFYPPKTTDKQLQYTSALMYDASRPSKTLQSHNKKAHSDASRPHIYVLLLNSVYLCIQYVKQNINTSF